MTTLSEKLTAILAAKADIKAAIEAKGVDATDATFGEYAGKIAEIGVASVGFTISHTSMLKTHDISSEITLSSELPE